MNEFSLEQYMEQKLEKRWRELKSRGSLLSTNTVTPATTYSSQQTMDSVQPPPKEPLKLQANTKKRCKSIASNPRRKKCSSTMTNYNPKVVTKEKPKKVLSKGAGKLKNAKVLKVENKENAIVGLTGEVRTINEKLKVLHAKFLESDYKLKCAEKEQEKTREILCSIINALDVDNRRPMVNQNAKNGELLGTLCDVLSSRLQQDFTSTTQNVRKIINIH